MPADGLLVIVPVIGGMEARLRETLNTFGRDIRGVRESGGPHPRIDFTASRTTHFARLTLLEDPDRGPGHQRLLLATDYDGAWEWHVAEILALSRQPEAIWGCCEGYAGPAGFAAFIRRHTIVPGAYYIAFRDESLERVRGAIALREWFQAWLSDPKSEEVFRVAPDVFRIGAWLQHVWRIIRLPFEVAGRAGLAAAEVVRLMWELGPDTVFRAAMQINATLNRIGWIRPFNALFRNVHKAPPHPFSQAAPGPVSPPPPGHPPEDAVHQNQLTLLTDVLPDHRERLAAVLALIDLYGRRLSSPGSLVGISTIHTVRWAMIDGGRRLLMVSNYDGTWENYIDEFAEMILSGLDALWTSSPDYPEAGAQDVAALKQFLRSHQAPANAFYSAYPEATVLNLQQDLVFDRWYGRILRHLAMARESSALLPARPNG